MSFITPLNIHTEYGVQNIPDIEVLEITQSSRKNRKYAITVRFQDITKTIHYGDPRYQQFEDRTPNSLFSTLNHHDNIRRKSYLARSSKIHNKNKELTCNDPFSGNRYSIITLW